MTTKTIETYSYPNKIGRIILQSMEEILGQTGLKAVLNHSNLHQYINNYPPNNLEPQFKLETLSRLQESMEDLYGVRGGRGLALRTGRAAIKYGLPEFSGLMGMDDISFRLLPLQMKLKVGAEAIARTFTDLTDQAVRYTEEPDRVLWIIERCPLCWQRQTHQVACHMAVGILQEGLYWMSGGSYFNVEEIKCAARGDQTCTIAIDKEPFG
ncbi:MAG: 4-vinyl reductase [Anaerolineales bacterium]|nr:4-vinyl reductase [Anaerolineales bacterium]